METIVSSQVFPFQHDFPFSQFDLIFATIRCFGEGFGVWLGCNTYNEESEHFQGAPPSSFIQCMVEEDGYIKVVEVW